MKFKPQSSSVNICRTCSESNIIHADLFSNKRGAKMDSQNEHVAELEARITDLRIQLLKVADAESFKELLILIHRPGWTTPAEALLVRGVVDSMLEHTKLLGEMKRVLLNGSRAVELKSVQTPPA